MADRTARGSPDFTSAPSLTRTSMTTPDIGDPTLPGSEEAFSREMCSIAAFLSSMTTARDSPLSSKKHSRVPFSVLSGPTASSLIVRTLPFSIEMASSSPIAGLARKYRVGTTLP